jgi:hypothetical protein
VITVTFNRGDRRLVADALRWGVRHGWKPSSHVRHMWYSPHEQQIFVAYRNGRLSVVLPQGTPCNIAVSTPAQALNVLAALDLLPSRFSTFGRQALEDHAYVVSRLAYHYADHGLDAYQRQYVAGLIENGETAQRMIERGSW